MNFPLQRKMQAILGERHALDDLAEAAFALTRTVKKAARIGSAKKEVLYRASQKNQNIKKN